MEIHRIKAGQEGVDAKISHSLESVREFFKLNCITRKYYGLLPQPFKFFAKIHKHIISTKNGFVVLASYLGKNIAGAVYFHSREKALFKYGASDRKFQFLRPNNLVMWEAIKWYIQNGFKSISFGRTEQKTKAFCNSIRDGGQKRR